MIARLGVERDGDLEGDLGPGVGLDRDLSRRRRDPRSDVGGLLLAEEKGEAGVDGRVEGVGRVDEERLRGGGRVGDRDGVLEDLPGAQRVDERATRAAGVTAAGID